MLAKRHPFDKITDRPGIIVEKSDICNLRRPVLSVSGYHSRNGWIGDGG